MGLKRLTSRVAFPPKRIEVKPVIGESNDDPEEFVEITGDLIHRSRADEFIQEFLQEAGIPLDRVKPEDVSIRNYHLASGNGCMCAISVRRSIIKS